MITLNKEVDFFTILGEMLKEKFLSVDNDVVKWNCSFCDDDHPLKIFMNSAESFMRSHSNIILCLKCHEYFVNLID